MNPEKRSHSGPSPLQRAIVGLEETLDETPDNIEILVKLGEAYLQAGCFRPKALPVFEKILANRPRSVTFQNALSIAFLVQQIQDLVESAPEGREVTLNETIETLEGLILEFPDSPDLRKALGDLRLLGSNALSAVENYEKAIELGFDPVSEIIHSFECAHANVEIEPDSLLFFARQFRLTGQEVRAVALLESAVDGGAGEKVSQALLDAYGIEDIGAEEAERLSPKALGRVLTIYLDSGHEDKVEALIDRLSQMSGSHADLFARFAQRLIADNRPWDAYQRLKLIPVDSVTKDLLNQAATKLEEGGLYDETAEVLRYINEHDYLIQEGTQIHQRNLEVSTELELADLNFKNQRYAMAFEKYINVLELGASNIDELLERIDGILSRGDRVDGSRLLYLAEFCQNAGEIRRAITYLKRLLESDPEHAEAIGRLDALLGLLLQTDPNQPDVRLERGELYMETEKYDQAIEDFLIASGVPDFAGRANRNLTEAYSKTGEWVLALERFRALPLEPGDAEKLYEVHLNLEKGGVHSEALQALHLIRDIDLNYRDIQDRIGNYEKAAAAPSITIDPRMRGLIGDLATGRYRYVEKIGSGGMGVVHHVFDTENNRPVAMKILREGLANSNKVLMRFIREAQYADQLNHPNIVHIYDFNVSKVPGQSYITMEFIDGPSFREILDEKIKDGFHPDSQYVAVVLDYCAQLCDALDATHKKGIIHRDIKPDNIMVNSAGVLKITDFGIVHVDEGGPTPTGALLGTPRYMAPEQVTGARIESTADIYSVGIVMYEMLTGSPPFLSGDIAYQQVNVRPPPPREIEPIITPPLNQIIMTCLEKASERRYQSARSLKGCLVEEIRSAGAPGAVTQAATESVAREDRDLDLEPEG